MTLKILETYATDKPGPSSFEIIPDGSDRVRISVKVASPTEITEWEIKYWEGDAKEPKVKKHKLTKRASALLSGCTKMHCYCRGALSYTRAQYGSSVE